jgi:hypothetical protein
MRTADDLMVASHGDLEMERFRQGGLETEFDPDDTWKAPARPVVFFFTCLLGWAAVVGAVIYLLLG